MITVIIPTLNDAARLVACLSPLVPASMEGLIRELIIVDGGSTDETLEIAEDAGARVVTTFEGGLDQAAALAKGPWLLVLDPQVVLERGWETAVRTHVSARRSAVRITLAREGGGLWSKLFAPGARAELFLKQAGPVDRGGRGGYRGQQRIGKAGRLNGARGLIQD